MKRRHHEEGKLKSVVTICTRNWIDKLWPIYKHLMLALPFVINHDDINTYVMDTIFRYDFYRTMKIFYSTRPIKGIEHTTVTITKSIIGGVKELKKVLKALNPYKNCYDHISVWCEIVTLNAKESFHLSQLHRCLEFSKNYPLTVHVTAEDLRVD
jgi:hypothetical protein